MGKKHTKLTDIFKQIDIRGPDECWNYTGYYNEERRMPEWKFKGKTLVPYRVVWELVKGTSIPEGQLILHSCDNRRCCNTSHHKLGTTKENNQEANDRDRYGMPKTVVRAIRKLLNAKQQTHQQIADLYGVSRSAITAIANFYNHNDGATDVEPSDPQGS